MRSGKGESGKQLSTNFAAFGHFATLRDRVPLIDRHGESGYVDNYKNEGRSVA
jgi:hypothetical protein